MTRTNLPHYDKANENIHICVIGAGVCGLTSVKIAREFGFQVTCFEKSPHYGGLWHYTDDRHSAKPGEDEFYPSVMRTTILNTSKELSAFSDFPPPAKLANFMKHSHYMDYIRSYVRHFQLEKHLKLSHEILDCKLDYCSLSPNDVTSGQKSIKWNVIVQDRKTGQQISYQFDRLVVATGHHNTPYMPQLPNQQQFKGLIIHSGRVKDILTDDRFVNKNVLVIGIANSACDAANDLAIVANKCIVSCHRGNWFLPRLLPGSSQLGYDQKLKCRWYNFFGKLLPTIVSDWKVMKVAKQCTNHQLLGLNPKHKPSELVPSINDMFPYRVFTGGIVLKSSLLQLTEHGAIFENEPDVEHPIDCVIVATGYKAKMPFLDELSLGLKSAQNKDEYDLFMNMFVPRLELPIGQNSTNLALGAYMELRRAAMKSLAIVGLFQPSGSIAVVSELQARLFCSVFSGIIDLPSVESMLKTNQRDAKKRMHSIRSHSRDQIVDDWIEFQDKLALRVGCKPNLAKLFLTDLKLWRQLIYGPSVAYQYRLSGAGAWPGARQTILEVPKRLQMGINEGQNAAIYRTRRKTLGQAPKSCKSKQGYNEIK